MTYKSDILFDQFPTPLLSIDSKTREIQRVNTAFTNRYVAADTITGYTLNEISTPIPRDLIPTEQEDANRDYLFLQMPGGQKEMVELISTATNDNNCSQILAVNDLFPPLHSGLGLQHPIFKSIFDKAGDLILVTNNDGSFIQVNQTACKKLGYSRDELLKKNVLDITYSPMRSFGQKQWKDFIESGYDEGEYILQTRDKSVLYTHYRAVANIRPGYHLSILRDYSGFKKIKQSEHIKTQAIESSTNAMIFVDDQFQIIYANQAFLDQWGYRKKEDILNQPINKFFNSDYRADEFHKQLIKGGKWQGELKAKHSSNTTFHVHLTANTLKNNTNSVGSVCCLFSAQDISDKLEFKRALNQSEQRFEKLLKAAPDAVLITREDGRIHFSNSKAEELFGYATGELNDKLIEDLIPKDSRHRHSVLRKKYLGNPKMRPMGSDLDLYGLRKDKTVFPVDIMLGPMEIDGEVNVLAIIRDISKYKEQQSKLQQEKEFTRLLHRLTIAANQASDFEDALQKSVDEICEFMDWEVGHAYLPANDESGEFYPTSIWHIKNPDEFDDFRQLTEQTRFRTGVGLIGKVMESKEPKWLMNANNDEGFIRRVPDRDLSIRACFAFPVLVGDRVVGILEFFSSQVWPSDGLLLEKMATIGTQLGRVEERIQASKQLEKSKTKFKALFESAYDAIFILIRDRISDCNSSAAEMFRISKEELMDYEISSLLPELQANGENSVNIAKQKLEQLKHGRSLFFEWRFLRPDGTLFDAEVSLNRIQLEGESMIQAIVRDITDRKRAQKLIQKNMNLFIQLFQNSPVGVVMLNQKRQVKRANKSFEKIFGYTFEEIRNKNIDDILVPESEQPKADKITERTYDGDSFQIEANRLHKSGDEIPVLVGTVPVTLEGEIISIFGIYVDISERKKAEEKIKLSLQEKEVLLAEIHHRVKNNLAVITGLLELQKDNAEESQAYQILQDSQSRIYSMALVHEQLYQTELFSSLCLDEYIRNLTNTIQSSFDDPATTIHIEIESDPLELTINQAVPCGLLLNELLTNAFKHAFPNQSEGIISIISQKSDEKVILQISDNGSGLPENIENQKTDSLGMNLIHTLSAQLDGTLNIESQKNQGTTFTLEFELESI